jgi:hypothetical protein
MGGRTLEEVLVDDAPVLLGNEHDGGEGSLAAGSYHDHSGPGIHRSSKECAYCKTMKFALDPVLRDGITRSERAQTRYIQSL